MDAPAKEIAIGRKINDFAIASPRRSRSARVAKTNPTLTATAGTITIHPRVLRMALSIVQSDEVLAAGVAHAEDDRVEDGVDEEHRQDHQGRAHEYVGSDTLPQMY